MNLPNATLLKASAGSGKTHALTKGLVNLLLSSPDPSKRLRSILAITFSNNAAKEMKERVLMWLKSLYFHEPLKTKEIQDCITIKDDDLSEKAGICIDSILENYSDFQIKTIDSFMAMLCKASAVEIGIAPDFDILVEKEPLLQYAFNFYIRRVSEGTDEARLLKEVARKISVQKRSSSKFLWNPSPEILKEINKIYEMMSKTDKEIVACDYAYDRETIKKCIAERAEGLNGIIERSSLKRTSRDPLSKILKCVRTDKYDNLVGTKMKQGPVLKPKGGDAELKSLYNGIVTQWRQLEESICRYGVYAAYEYYTPYLAVYNAFSGILGMAKRQHGKIFIDDINDILHRYLKDDIIPDIYCRLGERIEHYFIDEFQDTSPLQWANLFPLIENSLASGGTFFAVGDTKQAIYGFRDADYGIMKGMESENPFPSSLLEVKELSKNYRSGENIQLFNDYIFKTALSENQTYTDAAKSSGLSNYNRSMQNNGRSYGYVEVTMLEKDSKEPKEAKKICDTVNDLLSRGYRYADIAILALKNDDVIKITTWLNEKGIESLSYSSLDVRERKITCEILSLIDFLNSPLKDLSFADFIMGDIFCTNVREDDPAFCKEHMHKFVFKNRKNRPFYKAFQQEFSCLWDIYFNELFQAVGYMPLYDLVSCIYNRFKLFFYFKDKEEAGLVKILEVVKGFEERGNNNIKDFLLYAQDKDLGRSEWAVDLPYGLDKISVMTAHKSKGLGFPVVIVLLYGYRSRGFSYILSSKKGDKAGTASFVKIDKKISDIELKADRYDLYTIKELYDMECTGEMVSYLNSLYVGFTRPMNELYVIGVKGKKDTVPFDILHAKGFGSKDKSLSSPSQTTLNEKEEHKCCYITGHNISGSYKPAGETLSIEEKRLGKIIHKILFLIDEGIYDKGMGIDGTLDAHISHVLKEFRGDRYAGYIKETIKRFILHKSIKPMFEMKEGRVIMKEQEFVDRYGMVHRPDRVIIDHNEITIVDYKTGTERDEQKNRQQIIRYIKVLKDIFLDRHVYGLIAYIDPLMLREVRL